MSFLGQPPTKPTLRYALCGLLLAIFIAALYPLSMRLVAQLHCLKGTNLRHQGLMEASISHLEKAVSYSDREPEIWKELGETYYLAGRSNPGEVLSAHAEKSKNAFLIAARLNPIDAEAAFGMARAEAALEMNHPDRYHLQKKNPYHATPLYREAIRLRPNGILYHYAFAQYLYDFGRIQTFWDVIRNLSRIYPSVYDSLKKETFWSPAVRQAVKAGLVQAVDQGIAVRAAHTALSDIAENQKDWAGAISHYQAAMSHQTDQNSAAQWFHLGRLFLKKGVPETAEENFFTGLNMSMDPEKDLTGIYGAFGRAGYLEQRYRFYRQAIEIFPLSGQADILLARSLVDLNRYYEARRILEDLNRKDPTAEAYFWLYRIAELEKDMDRMELAIQKATVLEPDNSRYHTLFSNVLIRMKKLDRAEKHVGLAIYHADPPSHSLFNRRAVIRQRQGNFRGALADWQSAIELNPDNAVYYARAADACQKLGAWDDAAAYYEKAMKYDPGNKSYPKAHAALKEMQR